MGERIVQLHSHDALTLLGHSLTIPKSYTFWEQPLLSRLLSFLSMNPFCWTFSRLFQTSSSQCRLLDAGNLTCQERRPWDQKCSQLKVLQIWSSVLQIWSSVQIWSSFQNRCVLPQYPCWRQPRISGGRVMPSLLLHLQPHTVGRCGISLRFKQGWTISPPHMTPAQGLVC